MNPKRWQPFYPETKVTTERIEFLAAPAASDVALGTLAPALRDWFVARKGTPTIAQCFAWPVVATGENLLLSSPTGTGKTLAALMPIVDALLREPPTGLRCVYVAPLKALCRDAFVGLRKTLRSLAEAGVVSASDLRVGLRTGETSQRVRQHQRKHPPAILFTTPESLTQMLAHPASHLMLRDVRWVIVDEIHALIGDKRGADLAVSLERLQMLGTSPLQRIGLSATCAPLKAVAEFLVGADRPCTVAQAIDRGAMHFAIEPLFANLDYSPKWMSAVLGHIERELAGRRTTLIFTNTRSLAERLTYALRRRHPLREKEIAVHHSAISAARRRLVEWRMKHGRLWIVVSSTSLELGIDIGTVDHVIFVHPPGGVVRLLQRVGRSGHGPNQPRRGLLLTASAGELVEAVVTAGGGRDGRIEPVRVETNPLDVLCQQIVGLAMTGLWSAAAAFELIRRATPFRDLSRSDFDACLAYLGGRGSDDEDWLPSRLAWEGDCFTIADERTARLLRRNLGTILTEDSRSIRLREHREGEATTRPLGDVDEVYADRLQPGDRFVLDGRCVELKEQNAESLIVEEALGRPETPRWIGSGVPMSGELARRIYLFRVHAGETLREGESALRSWLAGEWKLEANVADTLADWLSEQERFSEIPTLTGLLIERVPMQSCCEYFLHTPLSRAANEAIARVLLHRWKRAGSFAGMALAGDLGIYVLAQAGDSITPEQWRIALSVDGFANDLREHLLGDDLLRDQFARVAQTGLMVLRNPAGRKRKVGGKDWTERRLFEQVREQEPNFVLLRQAERESLTGICDQDGGEAFGREVALLPIRVRTLSAPSPFGECLLRGSFRTEPIPAISSEAGR